VAPKDPVSGVGMEEQLKAINTGDTAWVLVSAMVVLIMTPGERTDPLSHVVWTVSNRCNAG